MTLPTLTWSKRTESSFIIAGAIPTLAEIITKFQTFVDGCTHWKCTQAVLDGANSRGYLEIAPRSAVAGITEGRCLITYNALNPITGNNFVTGNKLLPAGSDNLSRIWAGISSNANTVGPTNDPYTGSPYPGKSFSGLNNYGGTPPNGAALGAIESAEGIVLYWFVGSTMFFIVFGRLAESLDGNSAEWCMLHGGYSGWSNTVSSINIPHPMYYASNNHSAGSANSMKGCVLRDDGSIISISRAQFDTLATLGQGYAGVDYAVLQTIIASGGNWFNGVQTNLYCVMRQMRWGPPAFNLQRLIDSGSNTQAIAWNWSTSTSQVGAIWFDNQR